MKPKSFRLAIECCWNCVHKYRPSKAYYISEAECAKHDLHFRDAIFTVCDDFEPDGMHKPVDLHARRKLLDKTKIDKQ